MSRGGAALLPAFILHLQPYSAMVLTAKQRLACRLQKQGMAQTEIARAMRIRPESVSRLLSRAEQRIVAFARACGGPPDTAAELLEAALS